LKISFNIVVFLTDSFNIVVNIVLGLKVINPTN